MMNRRSFMTGFASVPVLTISAELIELLAPKRAIFLPPRGGWFISKKIYLRKNLEDIIYLRENLQDIIYNVDPYKTRLWR